MFNVGAIFRVNMYGLWSTVKQMSMTFQFQLATGPTPMAWDDVIDDLGVVAQTCVENFAAVQHQYFVWTLYDVATLNSSHVSGLRALPSGAVGEIVDTAPLPNQTTCQVSFPTSRSRRILKKALMGQAEASTGPSGNWLTAHQTAVLAAFSPLLLPVSGSVATWVYCHSVPDGDPTIYPLYPQSVKVNLQPCVQRRRRYS